jgi:flagellar basal body-associated protein FliL
MKSQKGSAHVVIVIILVLTLLGTLGFIFWQNFSAGNSKTGNTENTQDKTKTDSTEKKGNQLFLTIKEWGAKIPLSRMSEGSYYSAESETNQNSSSPTNLVIYSTTIDKLAGPTGEACKGEYIANLLRLPSNDDRWESSAGGTPVDDSVSPLFVERKVIGNYRYAISTFKSYGPTCLRTSKTGDYVVDKDTEKQFGDVVTAFKQDFQNIQAQ